MKKRITYFFCTYLLFVFIFLVGKIAFMAFYHEFYADVTFVDCCAVLFYGLPLDFSMSGYLTILPAIFLILSIWLNPRVLRVIERFYFYVIALVLSLVFVGDMALYGNWGFRLDTTPLFYLRTPQDAMASANWWTIVGGVFALVLLTAFFVYLFERLLIRHTYTPVKKRLIMSFCLLLLSACLFLPIRGGFSVATMNTGQVYFSSNMRLNHAAINPFFSFLESVTQEKDFDKQYRFLTKEQAAIEFKKMIEVSSDSVPQLVKKTHPNVVVIVLESFSYQLVTDFANVAPNLNKIASEGLFFTNFYANSFRTDRGLVSILSGYPAQPKTSIMKFPHKTGHLPSFPKVLKEHGYQLNYYYGGDADFTNMRSYLRGCGFDNIVCDKNFPLRQRLSKWGAHDDVLFEYIQNEFDNKLQSEPFLKVIQTSSSHEPFDVPMHKFDDLYLNSVAFVDSCLGKFVTHLQQSPYWDNTLVLLVPDHAMRYPYNIDNFAVARYHIPVVLTGGALTKRGKIETYASQVDLAATLLAQLDLPHNNFMFSKNIFNPSNPQFGWFTCPNFFGLITPTDTVVYDCDANQVVVGDAHRNSETIVKGKAFLQTLYDDLQQR